MTTEFDIALSFAGEDRDYVEKVAEQLKARGISVFYDKYEEANLWGKDLFVHLAEIYQERARFMLMFVSAHYSEKLWTSHERQAAQARAFRERTEYILPARFDDSDVPGLLPTTSYLDLRKMSPAEVAVRVAEKLGRNPLATKANEVPPPSSPQESGTVRFNHKSFDGNFRLGSGAYEFQTRWSRNSATSVHSYNNGNIRAIGVAPTGTAVVSLALADIDFTSSSVTPELGEVVVMQNTNGFYAAVRIDGVKMRGRAGHEVDELRIAYWILVDGSADFSAVKQPAVSSDDA